MRRRRLLLIAALLLYAAAIITHISNLLHSSKGLTMSQRFFILVISAALLLVSACKEETADALSRVHQEWTDRAAKIELIKDTKSRENFDQMARFLQFMEISRIEAKTPPKATRYTTSALARLEDYTNPAEMAEVFLGTLIIETFSNSLKLQEAFSYPLPYEMDLNGVRLADGQIVTVSEAYFPERAEIQAVRPGSLIDMVYDPSGAVPEGQALPTHVSGTFTAELPGAVLQVEFGANESGKTRQVGDYSVTLVKVDGHQVAVEIARIDGGMPEIDTALIYIEARDQTGQFLDDRGSGWGDPEDFNKLIKALDVALDAAVKGTLVEADPDTLFEKISEIGGLEDSKEIYGEVDFLGTPDRVRVTMLAPAGGERISREITLSVLALERFRYAETPDVIAVSGPVYNHGIEAALRDLPVDLTAKEIATGISVVHSEYGNSLTFNYPDVQSDIFIDGFSRFENNDPSLLSLTFLDAKGEPITVTDEGAYEFTVNRIEYDPARFSHPPIRVTGQVPVQRLTGITRVAYAPDDLPKGLSIKGNMLLIDPEVFPTVGEEIRLFATNGEGRFLSLLHEESIQTESGIRQKTQYYYGEIGGVVLLERGGIETLSYVFEAVLEPVSQ